MSELWQAVLGVVLALGGGGTLVLALAKWTGGVLADRLLADRRAAFEREMAAMKQAFDVDAKRLGAWLERGLHVSRLHYETEFSALRAVWSSAAKLRAAMPPSHRSAGVVPIDEDEEQRLARLREEVQHFESARGKFLEALYGNGPFLPPDVYAKSDVIAIVAGRERMQVWLAQPGPFSSRWFDQGDKAWTDMLSATDALFESIRSRVSEVQAELAR